MPMDYRVTLDCGHTYTYRTTVNPLMREQLICGQCGAGHHAAKAVLHDSDQCEFHAFTPSTAWTGVPDPSDVVAEHRSPAA
jgi:hypothetical protein